MLAHFHNCSKEFIYLGEGLLEILCGNDSKHEKIHFLSINKYPYGCNMVIAWRIVFESYICMQVQSYK